MRRESVPAPLHQGEPEAGPSGGNLGRGQSRLNLSFASFRSISAIYVWIVLIAFFGWRVPSTFLTVVTVKTLLDQQAITAILAVALVVPLAAGVYDLSIGYSVGVSTIFSSWLMVNSGIAVIPAVLLTLALATLLGAVNGVIVVKFKINSFIATLATSSGMAALITAISGNQEIIGLPSSFERIGTAELFGLALPVYYLLVFAAVVWYVMEYTPTGRNVYATGGSPEVARLSGIRTGRVIFGSLVVSAVAGGVGGIAVTGILSTGSPDTGPSYLLPAFAAAFLGATQIRVGRFNVWGTVLAVYVLATGVEGFQLMGAPFWLPDAFNCVALLVAVGLSAEGRARAQKPDEETRGGRPRLSRLLRPRMTDSVEFVTDDGSSLEGVAP